MVVPWLIMPRPGDSGNCPTWADISAKLNWCPGGLASSVMFFRGGAQRFTMASDLSHHGAPLGARSRGRNRFQPLFGNRCALPQAAQLRSHAVLPR